MKRIFAMIMVLCLLCGAFALAEDNRTTVLTTTIEEGYTITIPARLEIEFNAGVSIIAIKTSNVRLKAAEGEGLTRVIHVSASEKQDLTCGENVIPYRLDWNNPLGDFLAFTVNGSKNIIVYISFSDWSRAKAGAYEGHVTFDVSLQDIDMTA